MRYLVVNETGYGRGDTLRGAIDAYREAVRPGAQVEHWTVGIAPSDDWLGVMRGGIVAKSEEVPVMFELDLR